MNKGYTIEQPPHGYVRYVDHFGSDTRIVEAARVSYDSPSKGDEQDRKLLGYLYKNRHTSPFEQCNVTYEIKFPIFLMRQLVRHRTFRLNEMSARYTEMPDEFYFPNWRKMGGPNKQGSIEVPHDGDWHDTQAGRLDNAYKCAYTTYQMMIADGVCKEQARIVLPVGLYTKIYLNCDVHNLMHFLRLRLDSHAQKEMQEVARAMFVIANMLFPWTFELFDEYTLTMSKQIHSDGLSNS